MKACALLSALLISGAARATEPLVMDFRGTLPPQATLLRSTPRVASDGTIVPPGVPRFETCAVGSAAISRAELPSTMRILGVGQVGATTYTLVYTGRDTALTTDTPGLTTPVYVLPDPSVQAKLGSSGAEWGWPKYAEIHPDGTMIIVSGGAGPERRMAFLRTTVSTFSDPDGFSLASMSPYAPPEGFFSTTVALARPTFLPHLGITVSTIAEYQASGLASTAFPGDGRSLGFGSSDGGRTWTRLIDTDDPVLGRQFFSAAKHLHRVQAFEWYEEESARWKIGAIGMLGDGTGASGEIFVYSPMATYPPEGQNSMLVQQRTQADTTHMLTDLFPLNPSASPGHPMTFLQGPDTTAAGIVRSTIDGQVQHDEHIFRPTIPNVVYGQRRVFARWPYVFHFARLGNGAIVAPLFDTHNLINPNGIWVSDPSGTHWTTAHLRDTDGFRSSKPFGENTLWLEANNGDRPDTTIVPSLWDIIPPEVRSSLQIGCGAGDVQPIGLPTEAEPSVTDVSGTVAPPPATPPSTPVYSIHSQTMAKNRAFWTKQTTFPNVQAGQWITLDYWVKPAKPDLGVQVFTQSISLSLPGRDVQSSAPMYVEQTINDWQRVLLIEQVTETGTVSVTTQAKMKGDASASVPLSYFVTNPQLYVTSQPTTQHFEPGKEGADHLSVQLPPLAASWSVAISGTEARSWVTSLLAPNADAAVIRPSIFQDPVEDPDLTLREGKDVALELSTTLAGTTEVRARSHPTDNCFPAQNLVVLTMDASRHRLTMWVSRGLGELDEIQADCVTLTPDELRFATPDWTLGFEGLVHTVKVWPDRAITRREVEIERCTGRFMGFPPLAPCTADLDDDGATNIFDFGILASSFGGPGGFAAGDLDGNCFIDVNDLAILLIDFGCGAEVGAATSTK